MSEKKPRFKNLTETARETVIGTTETSTIKVLEKRSKMWWSTMNPILHYLGPTCPSIEDSTTPTKTKLQTKQNFMENKSLNPKS